MTLREYIFAIAFAILALRVSVRTRHFSEAFDWIESAGAAIMRFGQRHAAGWRGYARAVKEEKDRRRPLVTDAELNEMLNGGRK